MCFFSQECPDIKILYMDTGIFKFSRVKSKSANNFDF